jgi:hypothetical protein
MRTLEQSEDDLLTKYQVTKASLSGHLDKLQRYSQGCEKQALKSTPLIQNFCAQETGYLGYILMRDGIKPQSH